MLENVSTDNWLKNYPEDNAPESWIEFLKLSSPELMDKDRTFHEPSNESFDTISFFKASVSEFLNESLASEKEMVLYTYADKCMRHYELKKRLVEKYRFEKSWKGVSNIEIEKEDYGWFCIFLLAAFEQFNDIRFLNTCCKVFDKIGFDRNLKKHICNKITGAYVTK